MESEVFRCLAAVAEQVAAGTAVLSSFLSSSPPPSPEGAAERLRALGDEGDELLRVFRDELDRERSLAFESARLRLVGTKLLAVLKLEEQCATALAAGRVSRLGPTMIDLVRLACEAASGAVRSVAALGGGPTKEPVLQATHARALEREGGLVFRKELARVFEDTKDLPELMARREALEALSRTIDTSVRVTDAVALLVQGRRP